ncbi:intermembrane lipid transfer protein Vps13 isoform X1 [Bombus flavifrons]|uniref:intermembrane lipid transfer protein Vps13 isoform X1 n=1 Tax=Bombus flavifrons TaxID=103934 RepID=UPI0037049998
MVFESIVAELLNKVLGEYIQNLDCTQLKLSLWGGDVVLKDLLIKESALDILDLPIRLEYGRLGKLILKIPFKDMWNGQIDAIVEELFILVVPSSQVAYDAEKEARIQLEAKHAELARVEKKKQLADIKSQEKLDDSMIEKLIARMIKNIHIEIKKIHVRYEDHISYKDHPFSVGFTLSTFTLESCTDSWQTTGNLKDMYAIPQIYKLCTLDGLAVYLNTTLEQFSNTKSDYLNLFHNGIATIDYNPPGYQYLLGPINVNAKLKLNPKPETDGSNYTIPKVWLDMEMQKLRIGLARKQYQTIVQLGEGLDQAQKAAPFRKYRPNLTSYRGHYKEWWKFAYVCVLEEEVRRKRRNWDWNHMKEHRDMCRSYADSYQTKLTTKKVTQEIADHLTQCERRLDIFNLVIIRQKIEMEVERMAEREKNLKAKRGWFGFLWSSTQTEETQELNSAAAIMRKFEQAMTPQEKEKLYRAIDYQENSAPAHYPETYEMIDTRFLLHELQIIILDTDKEHPCILDLQLHSVEAGFKSRPSANAILVTASINEMKLLGTKQDEHIPSLFNSHQHGADNVLISVSYEKNPLDKLCGDRMIVKSKSVDIIYDAQTVIEIVNLFKVQNSSTLNNLQAAAAVQLEGLKEMSALGLEHAIQKHSVLDIQVNMQASQLIIPHDGFYDSTKSLLVVNLGSLQIHSLEKPKGDDKTNVSVKQLISMGKTEEDVLLHLREHSYDKFVLKIVDFQVLVSLPGEEWRTVLSNVDDSMTLLHPTTLEIQFHKCLVTDDPLLPKLRLIGQLPSVVVNITDIRLLQALSIAQSIPQPKEEPTDLQKSSMSKSVSQLSLLKDITTTIAEKKKEEDSTVTSVKQTIDMEMKFEMKEFAIQVSSQKGNEIIPFVKFEVLQLEAEMLQRTYDQEILLRLGGVQVKQHYNQREIFMITTPMLSGRHEYLITVQYINVNKRSPEFKTKYGSVLQLLKLEFTTLDVLLHQEALINLLQFISYVQDQMNVIATSKLEKEPRIRPRPSHLVSIQEETSTFLREQIQKQKLRSTTRRRRTMMEHIDLKVKAKVGTICMKITSDCREITAFYIDGITAGFIMKASYSQANVNLSSISIKDLNEASGYKDIVSVTEDTESLQIQAIMYNIEPSDIDKNNMSITIVMGCYRIVFLNMFVTSIMSFLNNFQTAQQAIRDASAAAAEAAKTNIKDVKESAARIGLAVKIKAPVIYVPMHSKSDHCLTLDMGNLTICNVFKKLEVTNDAGDYPIVDEMRIELQNLKLSRVRLNMEKFAIKNEILLLEPVSFTLLIKRNLSTAWFTSIPDIDMSGRLNKINILISKEDYATALKVLEKNLGETVEDTKLTASVSQSEKKLEVEVLQHRQSDRFARATAEDAEDPNSQEQVHTHTSIKFEFVMDSLMITLFTGGSKMLQSQSSLLHLPENGLAKFCLTHFALKGRIFADGLMATSILLMNCTLDDIRQNRQGSLTRIMERTTAVPSMDDIEKESKPVRSMLDMTIRQSSNDMFVDIRVFSFSIIVSLDYLMKVKDFFTTDEPSTSKTVQPKNYNESAVKKKQTVSPTKKMFTVNVHIEKPDIILLEDMDDINSNCIILNTELLLKVRIMDEHQVIAGTIKDLSILAGIYNTAKRSDWIYQVLRPCSISVAGSTPEGKGLHIDICCTDIHLSVSPGVIEILNKVVHTATKTQEQDQEVIITERNYEGLWVVTPFEENDFWFLKTEVGVEAIEDIVYSDDEDTTVYKPELAIISAPTILLTLEAGIGNKTLPMLLLHIGFESNISDWSTKTMNMECTMSVIMAYYNSCLALWEPLIEPIEGIRNEKRVSTPWELKVKIQFNDVSPDSRGASAASPTSDSETEELHQIPKMSIDIISTENLEITVTKTCLDVLQQLGNAFSSAMEASGKGAAKSVAPYVLKNETGLAIVLDLERSHFKVFNDGSKLTSNNADSYMEVILESGASVQLAPRTTKTEIPLLDQLKIETIKEKDDDKFIISFKEINRTLAVPVLRADKRFFSLKYRKDGSEEWGIVSDVIVDEGSTIVTLRSILQVHNHFSQPISVYYMTKRGNEVECVGTVAPDSKLNLPLDTVYTPTNVYGLFFSVEGYMVSLEQFIWKDLQKTVSMTKLLKCEARVRQEAVEPFYIKMFFMMIVVGSILYNNNTIGLLLNAINWRSVFCRFIDCVKRLCLKTLPSEHKKYLEAPIQVVGEMEQVYFETTSRHTIASTIYNVHLYPAVYLKNFLPIDIIVCLPGNVQEKLLEAGTSYQIPTIDPGKSYIIIKLPNYLEKDWSCRGEILANPPEFSVWSFESFDSAQKVIMDLGMHTSYKHGSIIMALYCPFWMLNKTGLMLSYRKSSKGGKEHSSPIKNLVCVKPHQSRTEYKRKKARLSGEDYLNVLYHPENFKGPILFSFRSKVFFGKKKAMIRVENGEWSDKFPIDVAGSEGVVICKYNGQIYQIGVHNQLTYNSLTKQITFTPYYVLINNSDYLIECQEGNRPADPMIKVPARECAAYWPRSDHEQKTLSARIAGNPEKTAPFIYTENHTTLLKLNNKYGGINVDIQISEGGVYISLSAYTHGNAPALIINHTPHTINFWEKGSLNVRSVQSYNRMFYTWENPAGPRKLVWEDNNKKEIEETLRKDTLGGFQLPDLEEEVYYVSFLDGTQRVLLFTTNMKVAEDCELAGDFEPIEQEITISIHGVGFSLVNNVMRTELLYLCIASSGIMWETRKSVNHRWRNLDTREVIVIEEGYQKYIRELQMDKSPIQKVILEPKLEVDYLNMEMLKPHRRCLRRTFQTGLWLQYRTSVHQVQLHAKINRLQIDNQLTDCVFPVILAPVPPPKSVTASTVMKPFAELSMVKRLLEHSNVQQFRYFKVLIQEFHVKVDIVFINAIVGLFEANEMNDVEESKLFKLDMKLVDEPLMYHVSLITTAEQKNFFDLLHFSPLKIHISFSMSGSGSGPSALPQVLNVLLQGIGVTLTDINDIVFKLAYFEREYIFMTNKQLISEATTHYVGQAIKQVYVLVLGLDVIGNPYGLVVGTMKGIEDLFYEPFQGAIQGPGEFAEGLLLGMRSMLGHTVGGMAGAVSKITGAMGKGIAALTFDKDYQRKRQEQLNKQPANLQEGLARSGKGLIMGVVDGVTGVVMKPISGAKEEGVEGFFKGFGKGMVGLVTRPTAGVIDFASGSFGAVKRATELNEEVKKVRPSRFLQLDCLVRPYVRDEAEGHKILCELEKGKYANTDIYFYHMYINKDVLLLTDKRIAYLEHSDLFGGWRVHWTHAWQEMSEQPKIVDKGVQIFIKDSSKKKKLGLFGSTDQSKIILIPDYNIRQLLCNKMQQQINQYEL